MYITFYKIADSRDVLPPESWFEDEDCELLIQCWKWQRCGNNLLTFSERPTEMKEPAGTAKWLSSIMVQIYLNTCTVFKYQTAEKTRQSDSCFG